MRTMIKIGIGPEQNEETTDVQVRVDASAGEAGPLARFADAAAFLLRNPKANGEELRFAIDDLRGGARGFARARGRAVGFDAVEPPAFISDTLRPEPMNEDPVLAPFVAAIRSGDADAAGVSLGLLLGGMDPALARSFEDAFLRELDGRVRARSSVPASTGFLSTNGGGVEVRLGSGVIAAGIDTRPDNAEPGDCLGRNGAESDEERLDEGEQAEAGPPAEEEQGEPTGDGEELLDEDADRGEPEALDEGDEAQAGEPAEEERASAPETCPDCGVSLDSDDPWGNVVLEFQIKTVLAEAWEAGGEVLTPSTIRGRIRARRNCGSMIAFQRIDAALEALLDRGEAERASDDDEWIIAGQKKEQGEPTSDREQLDEDAGGDAPEALVEGGEAQAGEPAEEERASAPGPRPDVPDVRGAIVRFMRNRASTIADTHASDEVLLCSIAIERGRHVVPNKSEEHAAFKFITDQGFERTGKAREALLGIVTQLQTSNKLAKLLAEEGAAVAPEKNPDPCDVCGRASIMVCAGTCGIRTCGSETCRDAHYASFEHYTTQSGNANNYACTCKPGKQAADCPRHVKRIHDMRLAEDAPRLLAGRSGSSSSNSTPATPETLDLRLSWHSSFLVWSETRIPLLPSDTIDGINGKAVRVLLGGNAPADDDGSTISELRTMLRNQGAASVEMIAEPTAKEPRKRYAAIVIGCCGPKNEAPAGRKDKKLPARDMYASHLFRLSLAYAEAEADRVYIASAFFDLIRPDTLVHTYNRKLSELGGMNEINVWGGRCASTLVRSEQAAGNDKLERIAILCGKDYAAPIISQLPHALRKNIEQPLIGKEIGDRKAWLIAALREAGIDPASLSGDEEQEEPSLSSGKGGRAASAPPAQAASSSSATSTSSTGGKSAPAGERAAIVAFVRKRADECESADVGAAIHRFASNIEAGTHLEDGEDECRAAEGYLRIRGNARGGSILTIAVEIANAIKNGAHHTKEPEPMPLFKEKENAATPTQGARRTPASTPAASSSSSSGKSGRAASAPPAHAASSTRNSSGSTPPPSSPDGKNKGGRPKKSVDEELVRKVKTFVLETGASGAGMGTIEKGVPGHTRGEIEKAVDALTVSGDIEGHGNAKARKYYGAGLR